VHQFGETKTERVMVDGVGVEVGGRAPQSLKCNSLGKARTWLEETRPWAP